SSFAKIKEHYIKRLLLESKTSFDYAAYVRELTIKEIDKLKSLSCAELHHLGEVNDGNKPHVHNGSPKAAGEQCTNPDFETCNFQNWVLQRGNVPGTAPYSLNNIVPSPGFTTVGTASTTLPGTNQHAITNGGNDINGGFPMVHPGGTCSALIGDFEETGSNASILTQTFLVSATDAVLILNYAVVLEDPGHTVAQQPYFRVRVYDESGNSLSCGSYEAYAGDGQAGWSSGGGMQYLPWTTVMIPLTAYIGTNVTVQFTVGDCSLSGHSGYAYVDASCQAFEVQITGTEDCDFPVNLIAPSGAASYLWDGGQTTQTITINAPGSYGVLVIPVQGVACGNYVDTIVVPFYPPTADAGPDFTICAGDAVQLQGSGVGNTQSWNNGGTLNNNLIYTPTATPGTTTTYTLTVDNLDGCVATDQATVTVVPYSNATINPMANVCDVDPPFNLTSVQPGGVWSGPGITNAATGTFDPSIAGPGTHTITYTINSMCPDTQTGQIIVEEYLLPTINPAGPFCDDGAAINLTAANPGGTWSGPGITNAATGTFNPTVAGAGTHTITYTIPGLCGDFDTENILVNPRADATINPQVNVCDIDAAFNLTSVQAGGVWSGTGITDAANGTFDPGIAGPGTHTITYQINSACPDTRTTQVTVEEYLAPTISAAGPFCDDEAAVNLTAANPGGTWSGTGITDAVNGTFNPTVAGAGTHTITYTIPGLCGDFDTEDILVNPRADATINPQASLCDNSASVTLTGIQAGGTWSGIGITDAVNGVFDPAVAGAGTHTITYSLGGPCPDAKTINIFVEPYADPTITPAGPYCETANPVNMQAVDPTGVWTGTGITDAVNGTFNPTIAGPGSHVITYTTPGGCGSADSETIIVGAIVDASIAAVPNQCHNGAPILLNGTDPNGVWSGTGITNPANGTFDPTVAGPGTHTVTYTITDICSDSQTQQILVWTP
ncbi:MAG: hypothetical protein ITG04_09975, partial [Proteiniphilum sp.]|nr:hypothetical protein [Proteiniphilum sp.]